MEKDYQSFIKKNPAKGKGVYLASKATVIGDVVLGDHVSVWPGAVIRGDMHHIRIGARSNIQDNAVLHVTHASEYNPKGFPLLVGEDVTVGHGAILHGCTIKNRVLIGMGAIIMDGAVVEPDIMIAAGALVTSGKILKSGFLYQGRPAIKSRKLTSAEMRFLRYSPANYMKLKDAWLKEKS